jgi:hypothetical protein
MAQAILDTSGKLDLYFRVARVGSKLLTFLHNGSAYSLAGRTFQLNIKNGPNSVLNVVQLLSGSGLTILNNTIAIATTELQSLIAEHVYYWELYETVTKQTWLCGKACFTKREPPALNDSASVTVKLDPDTVVINIGNISAIPESYHYIPRDWDNTENKFPDAGGSGTSGAIEKFNFFIGIGTGAWDVLGLGSEQINDGAIFIAKIDNPGQTPANWRYIG